MIIDGINLVEGTSILNPTIASGIAEPDNPNVGELFFNTVGAELKIYNGTGWEIVQAGDSAVTPYDISVTIFGKPASAAAVGRFVAVRDYALPANLTGSKASCSTAPTAQTVFSLKKNGTQIGTITFAASATTGTFSMASQVAFAPADVLTVVAPSPADSTFADAQFTLVSTGVDNETTIPPTNLVVPSGTSFPSTPSAGEIFFRSDEGIVYSYDGSSWTSAATTNYVDTRLAGLSWKSPVKAATTASITLSGTQTIDTVSLVAQDRVLVKDQSSQQDNGIYVVASGSWTRAADFDSLSPIDEVNGAAVYVQQGSANGDRSFTVTSTVTTIGSSAITWGQFTGASDPLKANLASPTFTGTPSAPTATFGNNSTQIATTAYVDRYNFYDASGSILGKPTDGAVVWRFITPRAFTLPAGLTGSQAYASTNSTGAQVLSIKKNGVEVGTMNWSAGNGTGSFTFASSQSFAAGDILTVVNQATADATFGDAQFTLVGTLA
jgi:hypothetical protein